MQILEIPIEKTTPNKNHSLPAALITHSISDGTSFHTQTHHNSLNNLENKHMERVYHILHLKMLMELFRNR